MSYRFRYGDRPLDDYTIQRAVGSGGFGEVYYAVSDGGREVALKYLRQNPESELRGVSHCINLKSPHLVSIFDVKQNAEGEYFIIMEYCSGPSLRDLLIAEPNGFPHEKAAFFVREIAKGLAYLHDRGIVHRDLKPGNIFYDDGFVKIGDYGLSKFISVSRHSAQTASVGTVHYMAPEIGSGNYSRGVDIYALGVMLYEMLMGRVPFEGSSMAEILMKHLTSQPEVDELPEPFGKVIRRALQKDPNDRYQNVNEMVDDLLAVQRVQESLAGFSPQSLEGAVRLDGHADSPMPSPNPAPGVGGRAFRRPAPGPMLDLREAGDVSGRVAKRIGKLDRKMEKRRAKLARKSGLPGPPPAPRNRVRGAARAKRFLPALLLTAGLSIGNGLAFGIGYDSEHVGLAGGFLILAMAAAIGLTRRARNWFGGDTLPGWASLVISLVVASPLLFLFGLPLAEVRTGEEVYPAVVLTLLVSVLFANWDHVRESGARGEMGIGGAIWIGLGALLAGAVMLEIFNVDDGSYALFAGVNAALTSLVVQANSWWIHGRDARVAKLGQGATSSATEDVPSATSEPMARGLADAVGGEVPLARPFPGGPPPLPGSQSGSGVPAVNRYGITRAFWSLVAFALTCGGIVAFVAAVLYGFKDTESQTGAIVAIVCCFSFSLFALGKTTMKKRPGIWRETIRPFLLSLMLCAIGGTIAGIANHWNEIRDDEARVALVAGLVISSLSFLIIAAVRGRGRQRYHGSAYGAVGRGPVRQDAVAGEI